MTDQAERVWQASDAIIAAVCNIPGLRANEAVAALQLALGRFMGKFGFRHVTWDEVQKGLVEDSDIVRAGFDNERGKES